VESSPAHHPVPRFLPDAVDSRPQFPVRSELLKATIPLMPGSGDSTPKKKATVA
jgi:hypothetical protein